MRPEDYRVPHNKSSKVNSRSESEEIASVILRRINALKERNKHLHSKEHLLADDLSSLLGEPKRFASYLGIAKIYYEPDLRALAKYVLKKADLSPGSRGRYFFGALRGLHRRRYRPKKKKMKRQKLGKNTHRKRTK